MELRFKLIIIIYTNSNQPSLKKNTQKLGFLMQKSNESYIHKIYTYQQYVTVQCNPIKYPVAIVGKSTNNNTSKFIPFEYLLESSSLFSTILLSVK